MQQHPWQMDQQRMGPPSRWPGDPRKDQPLALTCRIGCLVDHRGLFLDDPLRLRIEMLRRDLRRVKSAASIGHRTLGSKRIKVRLSPGSPASSPRLPGRASGPAAAVRGLPAGQRDLQGTDQCVPAEDGIQIGPTPTEHGQLTIDQSA